MGNILRIGSRMNDLPGCPIQLIAVPGLNTKFVLGRLSLEGTTFTRLVILNDQLTKIFAIGTTRAETLAQFYDKIDGKDDNDLGMILGLHDEC
jgi:hypothetical protein